MSPHPLFSSKEMVGLEKTPKNIRGGLSTGKVPRKVKNKGGALCMQNLA
jgi:hypothetical protein